MTVVKTLLTVGEKRKLLIQDHFPWGVASLPPRPASTDPAVLEAVVGSWIGRQTIPFGEAALALAARVRPILVALEARVSLGRLLARIDCSSHVKSPASILEKMVRDWVPEEGDPTLNFGNFHQRLYDLGRFRIVANFISDAERIAQELGRTYTLPTAELSLAQQLLRADYSLDDCPLVDSMHLAPGDRKAGARCIKGVFRPRRQSESLAVEVQVQTQLQEAWDKKDHFLVYEPRRRGEAVEPRHEREIFAMSELLYIADLTFDRLRGEIVAGGSHDAPA